MHAKSHVLPPEWADPDLPEWTDAEFDMAQLRVNGVIVRPATGKLTGRPPLGDTPKRQVTLRLDADVLDRFRAGGKGWQSRINAVLRGAVGL